MRPVVISKFANEKSRTFFFGRVYMFDGLGYNMNTTKGTTINDLGGGGGKFQWSS